MAKLYFKYGAMGSSKSAQALITQFNYEELGMRVWLIKPSIDDRDGASIVKSRVGLFREADVIFPEDNLYDRYQAGEHYDVIIADEAQFFTPEQIDQLRQIVDEADLPVLCFGLRTDFLTHLFPGSRRLMELADSITEIKTVCACGSKATVNGPSGCQRDHSHHRQSGVFGGNDSYVASATVLAQEDPGPAKKQPELRQRTLTGCRCFLLPCLLSRKSSLHFLALSGCCFRIL